MRKGIIGILVLSMFFLASCQRWQPPEPTSTPTITKTPWPTRTFTLTPVPPTQTPTQTFTPVLPSPTPAYIFTALDTDPWLEYANVKYNFAFYYPPDWVVTLDEGEDSETKDHLLWVQPAGDNPSAALRIGFLSIDQDYDIQKDDIGSGEMVVYGDVRVIGAFVIRELLIWEDKHMAVLYNGGAEFRRDKLVLALAFNYLGQESDPEALTPEMEKIADQIVDSLRWIETPTPTPTITPTSTQTPTRTQTLTPTETLTPTTTN